MIKKVLALMLVLSSVFLCGCDNSKRIDKAVIIECIIVDKSDYKKRNCQNRRRKP